MITKVLKLGLEGLVLKDLMVSANHCFLMSVSLSPVRDIQIIKF